MIRADEMPDDNADLVHVAIDFPRLPDDTAASCRVPLHEILDHLADEVPDGDELTAGDLEFLRTADVEGTGYWIWRFDEPGDDGEPAYLTVADDGTTTTVGYETDYYGLSPEQFILGDHHQVF
ncbi:MAG TPA: hypothetical protein VNS19_16890 [Acidimicrobiales bacterium]|nr:hypothetical protein [Acidimicrobiales bacterium]